MNKKGNLVNQHQPERKTLMIHPSDSKPKHITLTSPGIDDNSTLSSHSNISMSVMPEKEHPRSSTATILITQVNNEAVLNTISGKLEFGGSESIETGHSRDDKLSGVTSVSILSRWAWV